MIAAAQTLAQAAADRAVVQGDNETQYACRHLEDVVNICRLCLVSACSSSSLLDSFLRHCSLKLLNGGSRHAGEYRDNTSTRAVSMRLT